MGVLESSNGRKLAMAASGQLLLLFLLAHAAGNATLWGGAASLNAYAASLHAHSVLLWGTRLALLPLFAVHLWLGLRLTLENRAAKPRAYAVTAHRGSTLASRTMIWSGAAVALFLGYHLLHFTAQVLDPGLAAATHADALGRPDVARMVVGGLARPLPAAAYLLAALALGMHLLHGLQSSVQTWGLNGPRSFPWIVRAGGALAALLALAFLAIPAGVLAGLLR